MAGRTRHAPPHPWGWHQLTADAARRVVRTSGVGPDDLVLDIGAGLGALSVPLLRAGARVIAVELHAERLRELRRLAEQPAHRGRLTVVRADAADLRLPRRGFHVVSNPPFAITSTLLRRLLHPGSRMISAHVVLQAAAARRWCSPSAPGAQRWQVDHEAVIAHRLGRGAFRPPPDVDCAVLAIRPQTPKRVR